MKLAVSVAELCKDYVLSGETIHALRGVSFDVPQGFASRVGASEARLFFTGTNLALLHQNFGDWGFDPEANNIRAYPLMRTLSLGLNVSH